MPSLIDAYNFDASIVEKPKKRKTFDEVIANIEPAISGAVKNIKDYQDRTARQKEMDEAIAKGTEGYEWFNPEDPAHKALIEEYVRTGNANGIAQQRSMWASRQELDKSKADETEAAKKGLRRAFNRGLIGIQSWKGAEAGPQATAEINQHALSAQEAIEDLEAMGVDTTEMQARLDEAKGVQSASVQNKQDEIDKEAAEKAEKERRKKEYAAKRKAALPAAKAAFANLDAYQRSLIKNGATFGDYKFTYKELQ